MFDEKSVTTKKNNGVCLTVSSVDPGLEMEIVDCIFLTYSQERKYTMNHLTGMLKLGNFR
jgi:hypothetical protein